MGKIRGENFNLYLDSVVDVGRSISLALIHDSRKGVVGGNLVLHADRRIRDRGRAVAIDRNRVIQRHGARDSAVIIDLSARRSASSPEDNRVGIRISRRHAMREVELRRSERSCGVVPLVDFANVDPQLRVVEGGASVVEVGRKGSRSHAGEGQTGQEVQHREVQLRRPSAVRNTN